MNTTNAAWLEDEKSADAEQGALSRLNTLASEMGVDIVDVAGFLDDADRKSHAQLQVMAQVSEQNRNLAQLKEQMLAAIEDVAASSDQAREDVSASVTAIHASSAGSKDVSQWVQRVAAQLTNVQRILTTIATSNSQISDIAQQINMLAINAKIEAARAGEAGRGFSVVADAVNELSQRTAQVAEGITTSIDELSKEIVQLHGEAGDASETASKVIDRSDDADQALSGIETQMTKTASTAQDASIAAQEMGEAIVNFTPAFEELAGALQNMADEVHDVRGRVNALIDRSEGLIQASVDLGGASEDAVFIDLVRETAAEVSALFERAVESGRITRAALFDTNYTPIPGSDPQQVIAPCTQVTDALLSDLQEAVLEHSSRIVFCAAVDRNGYLPTHNKKFSAPQGKDPVWNAAHCRNRRIFDDRVGLKAGQSTAPFLLQTYRRNMGGGTFILMKDVASPIFVNGQHWGGVRLAFKPNAHAARR